MKRLFLLGLLALPASLLFAQKSKAQIGCSNLGAGGFCFKFLGKLHQDGPLWNYGPYSGYYPFEPYGPWNSQLQYTGPYPGGSGGGCSGSGCDTFGWLNHFDRHRSGSSGGDCGRDRHPWDHWGRDRSSCSASGWDRYARTTWINCTSRVFPLSHKHKWSSGCGTCTASTGPASSIAVVDAEISAIVPTAYPRRER